MTDILAHTPALILAGGLGTRLRPVLPNRPKSLAPIGDRPFLAIQIQLLRRQGVRRVVICVGHQAEQLQAELGDGQALGIQIEYSLEDPRRLMGTAGALKRADRYFRPSALVLNGDTYFDIDYARLLQRHLEDRERRGALATLALARLADRARYGNVLLDPSGYTVIAFREKSADISPDSAWMSAGVYVIDRTLLNHIPPDKPCSLEHEIFPRLVAKGLSLTAVTFGHRFFDIGTPEAWKSFTDHYSEGQHG